MLLKKIKLADVSGWSVILLGLGTDKSPVFQLSPIHKEHLKKKSHDKPHLLHSYSI